MKALKVWHAELDDMNKGLMQHMKKVLARGCMHRYMHTFSTDICAARAPVRTCAQLGYGGEGA